MKRVTLWLLAWFVILTITVIVLISHLGQWLSNTDAPHRRDMIVVLAGEPLRAFYAADLYLSGYADAVYVGVPVRPLRERKLDELGVPFPRAEEIYTQILIKKGVPKQRIRLYGKGSVSTVEEIQTLKSALGDTQAQLMVVTSPYHVRRVKMIFADVMPESSVIVVATPYEPFLKEWWRDQDTARNVILELSKIAFYLLGGQFSSTPATQ